MLRSKDAFIAVGSDVNIADIRFTRSRPILARRKPAF